MKLKDHKKIKSLIDDAIDNIVSTLEENRFYPSEREAGTAPNDGAMYDVNSYICKLIETTNSFDIYDGQFSNPLSLDDVKGFILANQDNNIADDFDCLKEIDTFVRDNGEQKYQYFNTVYEYNPTKSFIAVEEQRSITGGDFVVCSISVTETEKKEITTYEWS
jgi:hypothetical protein